MSNWGILKGLGAGMEQVGGSIFKAKVLDKLKEEETIRSEERADRRKKAELANTVHDTKYIERDGVWYEQRRNKNLEVIDERLAPKNEIDRLNTERDTNKITLDKLIADRDLGQKKLANYDADRQMDIEDRDLTRRNIESQIAENKAQAERALRPDYRATDNDDEKEYSPGELAQMLIEENEDIEKELTEAAEGETPKMSKQQFRQIAHSVIRNTSAGHDPRSQFLDALNRYRAPGRTATPVVPTKKMYTR